MDSLTGREKAAFIIGMVAAFESAGWPKHFNADDRGEWRQRATHAKQMLTGGVFNPLHAWNVSELADKELELL